MKKLLAKLFGSKSAKGNKATPADLQPAVQTMDPKTIGFTLPTLAAKAPTLTPLTDSTPRESPAFHEDDWRQLEFLPSERVGEISRVLEELAAFEKAHRRELGWTDIYRRELDAQPVIANPGAAERVARTLNAALGPPPVLFYGQMIGLGSIADGFSIALGGGVTLYGVAGEGGVNVLGASLGRGGDDEALANAFVLLNRSYGLVLVDWVQRRVLLSVDGDGKIGFRQH